MNGRAAALAVVLAAALIAMTVLAAALTAGAPQGPLTLIAFAGPTAVALVALVAVTVACRGGSGDRRNGPE